MLPRLSKQPAIGVSITLIVLMLLCPLPLLAARMTLPENIMGLDDFFVILDGLLGQGLKVGILVLNVPSGSGVFDPYTRFYLANQATLITNYGGREGVYVMNLEMTDSSLQSMYVNRVTELLESEYRLGVLEHAYEGHVYEYEHSSLPEVIDNTWGVVRTQEEYETWLKDNFTSFLQQTADGLDVIVPTGTTSPENILEMAKTMIRLPRPAGRSKLSIVSDYRLHNLTDSPDIRDYEENIEAWGELLSSIESEAGSGAIEVTVERHPGNIMNDCFSPTLKDG